MNVRAISCRFAGPAADPEGLRPAVRPRGPAAGPGQRSHPGARGPSDAAFVLPEVLFIAGHLAGTLEGHQLPIHQVPTASVNSAVRAMLIMYVRCESDLGHIMIVA
jgi:hypothetical protein